MRHVLDLLTSGVHDAKNQLFVAESLIAQAETAHGIPLDEARFAIEQAASRLTRVLTAYRLQRHLASLSIEMTWIGDLLDEAVMINAAHCSRLSQTLTAECDLDEPWPVDRELVLDMLANAIQNASRFARGRIRVAACRRDGMLSLCVEDDGPGFVTPETSAMARRGLGLFVASQLAAQHRRGERQGHLLLRNGGVLGGAVFELLLP